MALFRRREQPSRPPIADLMTASVEVAGRTLPLGEAVIGARVDGGRLSVEVHHPAFPDLADETRIEATVEILTATLGSRGLGQVVHQARPVGYPPIDCFGLESLRSFARSLGAQVDPPPPA